MRLYSYIVTHDTGFAPNPFFGFCTLACCKPAIRRTAQVGDWIVGLTPRADGNRIVYFMKVDEKLDFRDYWKDCRFHTKRPRYDSDVLLRRGDNIYEPLSDDKFLQHRSAHTDRNMRRDLRGKYVLISETFAYFGSNALKLPRELKPLIVCRGFKSRFPDELKERFRAFVGHQKLGLRARPRQWPDGDDSWSAGSCGRR